MKTLIFIVGIISLILGSIGAFLPLLPTTPFLLLSAACFYRSSKRMHNWLMQSRMGNYIKNYTEYKAIEKNARIRSLILMWVGMTISMVKAGDLAITGILLLIGMGVTIHLCRLNTV